MLEVDTCVDDAQYDALTSILFGESQCLSSCRVVDSVAGLSGFTLLVVGNIQYLSHLNLGDIVKSSYSFDFINRYECDNKIIELVLYDHSQGFDA